MSKVAPDPEPTDLPQSPPEEDSKVSCPEVEQPAQPQMEPTKLNAKKRSSQTSLLDFANTELMKQKVRDAKSNKNQPYNVHDYYHKTGLIQQIAKHPYFENTTLSIIVFNALWISIDTDLNKAETITKADAVFAAADSLFFIYFSLELIIRFLAFEKKCNCLKDAWFVFDSSLVTLYAFDPFAIGLIAKAQGGKALDLPTSVLRLFRLARLSRLVRMLRSLPELMIMIKGMMTAAASVGYTLGLLLLITYVFSIAIRNVVPKNCDHKDWNPCILGQHALGGSEHLLAGQEDLDFQASICPPKKWVGMEESGYDEVPDGPPFLVGEPPVPVAGWHEMEEVPIELRFFCSVPETMHSLIVFAGFLDEYGPGFVLQVKPQSTICLTLTWIYVGLASMTVLNMLVGVLCEVISAVAAEEKESMIVDKVHEKFDTIVQELDQNKDGDLSWDEFQKLLDYPDALRALESVNVDPETMVDMAEDFFFEDGEPVKVSFDEFMDMVLDLRGGQMATVKDVMGLNKLFNRKVMRTKEKFDRFDKTLKDIDAKCDVLLS